MYYVHRMHNFASFPKLNSHTFSTFFFANLIPCHIDRIKIKPLFYPYRILVSVYIRIASRCSNKCDQTSRASSSPFSPFRHLSRSHARVLMSISLCIVVMAQTVQKKSSQIEKNPCLFLKKKVRKPFAKSLRKTSRDFFLTRVHNHIEVIRMKIRIIHTLLN